MKMSRLYSSTARFMKLAPNFTAYEQQQKSAVHTSGNFSPLKDFAVPAPGLDSVCVVIFSAS